MVDYAEGEGGGADRSVSPNYCFLLTQVQQLLPRNETIMSEGGNTMNIRWTILESYLPRSRLDPGS